MANALYPAFKEAILNGEYNLTADAVMASLIDLADYTYDAADESYVEGSPDGVPDAAKVAEVVLTSMTTALGVFDSADFVWLAVSGDVSEAVLLWIESSGSPPTPIIDPLIVYYDTGVTGLPVTPNGGNINVTVFSSGWFAL